MGFFLVACLIQKHYSGKGDSQRDSRESIRANHSQLRPQFYSASGRFARITQISDSRESPDWCANHANRFARITTLSSKTLKSVSVSVIKSAVNKGAGRGRGPQKSSRNFVSERGRCRVQISLWLLWKEQSTILALFGRRILGQYSAALVLPAPMVYC